MFEVELNEYGKVRFLFEHNNPRSPWDETKAFGTACFAVKADWEEGEDTTPILICGETILHISDFHKYNKEFGRKLSLTRAIKGLPRSERAKIWKAYFEAKERK